MMALVRDLAPIPPILLYGKSNLKDLKPIMLFNAYDKVEAPNSPISSSINLNPKALKFG